MKGLLFLAALLIVAGFIWTPGKTDSSATPSSPATPNSQIDPAGLLTAVQAMPAMQRVQVQVKLQNLRTAFYMYVEETGDVPDETEGLKALTRMGGFVRDSDITDPWGREFVYRRAKVSSNTFWEEFEVQVFSAGPDGVPDTADDVHLP